MITPSTREPRAHFRPEFFKWTAVSDLEIAYSLKAHSGQQFFNRKYLQSFKILFNKIAINLTYYYNFKQHSITFQQYSRHNETTDPFISYN